MTVPSVSTTSTSRLRTSPGRSAATVWWVHLDKDVAVADKRWVTRTVSSAGSPSAAP